MMTRKIVSTLLCVIMLSGTILACSGTFSAAWAACDELDPSTPAPGAVIGSGVPFNVPSPQEVCQNNALQAYSDCIDEL